MELRVALPAIDENKSFFLLRFDGEPPDASLAALRSHASIKKVQRAHGDYGIIVTYDPAQVQADFGTSDREALAHAVAQWLIDQSRA